MKSRCSLCLGVQALASRYVRATVDYYTMHSKVTNVEAPHTATVNMTCAYDYLLVVESCPVPSFPTAPINAHHVYPSSALTASLGTRRALVWRAGKEPNHSTSTRMPFRETSDAKYATFIAQPAELNHKFQRLGSMVTVKVSCDVYVCTYRLY
jgi:hypothetical protein